MWRFLKIIFGIYTFFEGDENDQRKKTTTKNFTVFIVYVGILIVTLITQLKNIKLLKEKEELIGNYKCFKEAKGYFKNNILNEVNRGRLEITYLDKLNKCLVELKEIKTTYREE